MSYLIITIKKSYQFLIQKSFMFPNKSVLDLFFQKHIHRG